MTEQTRTEQDARPTGAGEEAWSVVLRYADTRLLKAAVAVLLVEGAMGLWLAWRVVEQVRLLTLTMEAR